VRAIEEMVTQIEEVAVSTGLIINENRTKYCKIKRNITNLEQYLFMDGQIFEVVLFFRGLVTRHVRKVKINHV
jgi:hypothetical protein